MTHAGFEISMDRSRIDTAFVHRFLTSSYWAAGRSIETVTQSISHSICFGGYFGGRQVAFGRLVTDTVVMAHVADVFVAQEYRGRGFGRELVSAMMSYIDSQGIASVTLNTSDAHGLYEQFGFVTVADSSKMMHRVGPGKTNAVSQETPAK